MWATLSNPVASSVLSGLDDGIIVTNQEGALVYHNDAAERILGARKSTDSVCTWISGALRIIETAALCPPDQIPLTRAMRGETTPATEFLFVRGNGMKDSCIKVTARPLHRHDGEVLGAVMVVSDVTDARHLRLAHEESESANRAKSNFLYRMSTELRTSLTPILGFAQMLSLEPLTEPQSDFCRHILAGAYRVLETMSEALDAAPEKSGGLDISLEPIRIRETLINALPEIHRVAEQLGVVLDTNLPSGWDVHIRADRKWLKLVLVDLLSDAIMLSSRGSSIVLSCNRTADNRVRFEIAYSGQSIALRPNGERKESREASDRSIEEPEGDHLGLIRSRRLIEAMGGSLDVSTRSERENHVLLDFALIEDPLDRMYRDDAALAQLASGTSEPIGGTVLCIEDDPSSLRLIERILAYHSDIQMISAIRGQGGLELARARKPDWILVDLHLPDMSGEEVIRRLLDDPVTQNIPVTVLTADAAPERIRRILAAGVCDFVSKPLDVQQMLSLLDKRLRQGING